MAKRETLTVEQVVAALATTNGLVYLAAERLQVSARTVYRYARRYPTVKEALDAHKGKRLDTAEASLWNAVLKGEAWAVCFYLKTQGKDRGYVERTETKDVTRDEVREQISDLLRRLDGGGGVGVPGEAEEP
jgi:hypothetical protein